MLYYKAIHNIKDLRIYVLVCFTFMKMASPLGTLTNMSPPTCSIPAKHMKHHSKKPSWHDIRTNITIDSS